MIFKSLVRQIDDAAEKELPLKNLHNESIVAWANLHGWDVTDLECQRLIVRQALLNGLIRRIVPGIEHAAFATPVDSLRIKTPQALVDAVSQAVQHSSTTMFNFWGELYNALIPQPQRRRIGQFWTDEQVAEWMVTWLLQSNPRCLVDVGCGAGNFLLKADQYLGKTGGTTELHGLDVSPLLLNVTRAAFLTRPEKGLHNAPVLAVQNYLNTPLSTEADAVICNPPYTRHHHIAPELKDALQAFFKARLKIDVSRQGTLAFFFLLKLIADMPEGARGAVILPMEVLDARYGMAARQILCQHTTLSAIIHFSPQMNAFHKVDVGASILLFKKGCTGQKVVRHLTLDTLPTTDELMPCLETNRPEKQILSFGSLVVQSQNDLMETSKWFGISAPELANSDWQQSGLVVPLKKLAKVVRGIATGANEFFVLSTEQVRENSLEPFVVRTLHRNREIQDIILDETRWQALSDAGKCVWLLYLNGEDIDKHPQLRAYLAQGEKRDYHRRSLVQTRRKWHMMEQREIPSIFFTILTRGNPRFILNRAGVRPVNMFSLIYPNRYVINADAVEILWVLLNSSFSTSRLHSVSRTYGGNTLKVEPRELDNLPVVNPLALPDEARNRIQGWIADFHRHQQTTVLMRQVDELIGELLDPRIDAEYSSAMPLQHRLFEKAEGQET